MTLQTGNCCAEADKSSNMRQAIRLEVLSVAWMLVEAAVAIGSGVVAHSLLLVAFGADSIIEMISASVLLIRLLSEALIGPGQEEHIERLEHRASRIAAALLYALSAYVIASAIWSLVAHHAASLSYSGLAVAAAAAVGMPILARAKIRAADAIGSRALRADAMESFTCGYLSWALFAGILANALFRFWWIDGAASLLIVPLLFKEAREAAAGECCCRD